MLKTVLTGLVAYTLFFVVNSASASASTLDIPTSNTEDSAAMQLAVIIEETNDVSREEITEKSADKKEKVHKIAENETLTDIAKKYDTTWKRLFDKNVDIESPDIINPGDKIVIPTKDEEVEARELPEPPAPAEVNTTVRARTVSAAPAPAAKRQVKASSSGNGYSYGYCTWHVKTLRSDLPNNLGNANTWAARARAQGFATGSKPRVGAVAQATTGYMHVAYVTSVNKNGTVTLSEMNFKGWGVVSSRTAPANQFTYIY